MSERFPTLRTLEVYAHERLGSGYWSLSGASAQLFFGSTLFPGSMLFESDGELELHRALRLVASTPTLMLFRCAPRQIEHLGSTHASSMRSMTRFIARESGLPPLIDPDKDFRGDTIMVHDDDDQLPPYTRFISHSETVAFVVAATFLVLRIGWQAINKKNNA